MGKLKEYQAKTLFDGRVIGKLGKFVAVPGMDYPSKNNFANEKNFYVLYQGKRMKVANWHQAESYRKFDDQFGRGHYTLAYFLWVPEEIENRTSEDLAREEAYR